MIRLFGIVLVVLISANVYTKQLICTPSSSVILDLDGVTINTDENKFFKLLKNGESFDTYRNAPKFLFILDEENLIYKLLILLPFYLVLCHLDTWL